MLRRTCSGPVPGGTVRFLTDEGRLRQESLPTDGSGTVAWRTTASLAAHVRAEVRHPTADGTPGRGSTMGPDLLWGPMAARTNPIVLRTEDAEDHCQVVRTRRGTTRGAGVD
ncbi:hypothetical protein ACIOJE_25795 [Kitasatospora sp. NPDC087861]|uniref:hypothetical protein n=1 Tax=Kitasatospora sp. NPDC087861 TaxID=3364070 RepID=UPI003828EACF